MTKQDSTTEQRREVRLQTSISAFIKWKLNKNDELIEEAAITSLSRMGAGFQLSHPCVIGRLVTLALPMERGLRAHDPDEELYNVVGLVQYCNPRIENGKTIYDVGAAFTGKEAPPSYEENPEQSYRVTGINESGLWQIQEQDRQFKARKHTRYHTRLNVILTLIRKSHSDNQARKEHSITRDISVSGASFPCSLDVAIGDKVKFACEEHNFYCFAVVRNRNETLSIPASVHLEFVDAKFPIEKITSLVPVQEDTTRPEREQVLRAEQPRPFAPPAPVEKPAEQPAVAEQTEQPLAEEPAEENAVEPAAEQELDQPVANEQSEEYTAVPAADEQPDQPAGEERPDEYADEPVAEQQPEVPESEEPIAERVTDEPSEAESDEPFPPVPEQEVPQDSPERSEEVEDQTEQPFLEEQEPEPERGPEPEIDEAEHPNLEEEISEPHEVITDEPDTDEIRQPALEAEQPNLGEGPALEDEYQATQEIADAPALEEVAEQPDPAEQFESEVGRPSEEPQSELIEEALPEEQIEPEPEPDFEPEPLPEPEPEPEPHEPEAGPQPEPALEDRTDVVVPPEYAYGYSPRPARDEEQAEEPEPEPVNKPWQEPVNDFGVQEYVYEPEGDLQEYAYEPQIVDETNASETHEYAYVADVITEVIEESDSESRSDEKGWSAEPADNASPDSNRS